MKRLGFFQIILELVCNLKYFYISKLNFRKEKLTGEDVLAKPKKISKKKMQEDKLVTTYYNAIEFYEEYQSKILIGLGVIAVVIAAIVLYSAKISEDNVKATTELSRVLPIFQAGSYQEAIEGRAGTNIVGFQKIVNDYSGTEQGEIAKVYLAHSYYYQSDFLKALEYYNDYSGSNELFQATALAGKAACYEALNDREEAAKFYTDAAFVSKYNPSNSEYLLRAGINYMEDGQKEEAKNIFKRIKEEYSKTQIGRDIDKYLSLVES